MKTTYTLKLPAAVLVGVLATSGLATQETHFNELANIPFAEGRPTKEAT